jgi:DivIVA domain-containing protein
MAFIAPLRLLHPDAQSWGTRSYLAAAWVIAVALLLARRWVNQLSRELAEQTLVGHTPGPSLRYLAHAPLSPEDVTRRQFRTTHFKAGYDQAEVDALLDEVVEELRRLNARIAELEARLR